MTKGISRSPQVLYDRLDGVDDIEYRGYRTLADVSVRDEASQPPSPPFPELADIRGATKSSSTSSNLFADVLVSLESVLNAKQFRVLEDELSSFLDEYRHQHYTACALRIGRTLEHVVYALATAWGVKVNRATLQGLSILETSVAQLSQTVIEYAAAIDGEKLKRGGEVRRQFEQASKNLANIAFELHNLKPKGTDVPLNVESIIRDIRKQFARHDNVRHALDEIVDEQILRKILDVRNNAAHASTKGGRRELNKGNVDTTVELLRTALFRFGNVALPSPKKIQQYISCFYALFVDGSDMNRVQMESTWACSLPDKRRFRSNEAQQSFGDGQVRYYR